MFNVGWSEMLVVGALALIVVGPKDLPRLMRSVGQWVGQARSMARQFQRSMEDAAREADIAQLKETRELMADVKSIGGAISNPVAAAGAAVGLAAPDADAPGHAEAEAARVIADAKLKSIDEDAALMETELAAEDEFEDDGAVEMSGQGAAAETPAPDAVDDDDIKDNSSQEAEA